jgi:ABC-2 type transport system permease protein
MTRDIVRNLRFISGLIRMKLSRMMMYRIGYFGAFFADGALFLAQLIIFETIYATVDSIGGWSRGQMIIFVGTFSMINGLNMWIYFFGVLTIPDKIKRGDLDHYLTKPVNPLLRITFENMNPGSFLLVIMSAFIIRYGVSVEGLTVGPSLGFAYAAMVLLMTLLWYDMELILRTMPFFVVSANGIMQLEGHLIWLNFRVPGVLFKGALKFLFYFLLPYGVMSTVPTMLLSGALTIPGLIHSLCVIAFFTAFALWFWKLGLKRYESAGG